jgi:hypothetical protein
MCVSDPCLKADSDCRIGSAQGSTAPGFGYEKNDPAQARQQDGELVWETHAIEHIRPTRTLHPVQISDETLIGRIKKAPARQTILLVDVQYLPEPVQNNKGDRPYFPRLMLIVDKQTSMPIGFEMYQDIERDADVVFEKLVDFITGARRPAEIHVRASGCRHPGGFLSENRHEASRAQADEAIRPDGQNHDLIM